MRLWTIQNQSVKDVLNDGIWYSNLNYRGKDIDYNYDLEEIGAYPIYAFATLNNSFLNLDTLRKSFKDIAHKYRLPRELGSDVLVELEVTDNDIINLKPVDCEHKDPVYFIEEGFREEVNRVIEQSKQKEISRYTFPGNYEVTLRYIKREQVVSISTIKPDTEDGYCLVQTIYTNKDVGYPSWSRPVYISTEGTYKLMKSTDSDLLQKKNMYKDVITLINSECSADMASNDMSIAEAIDFLNANAKVKLLKKFNIYKAKHPDATRFTVTVGTLEGDSSPMPDITNL